MNIILSSSKNEAFKKIFDNFSQIEDLKNLFILMNIKIEFIYDIAIEINSKELIEIAYNNNINYINPPSFHAIELNNMDMFLYVQKLCPTCEIRLFNKAIKTNNSMFIEYFLEKVNCITVSQLLLSMDHINLPYLFEKIVSKIDLSDSSHDKSSIINHAIKSGSLMIIQIIHNLGCAFTNQSLYDAIKTNDENIVEYVIQNISEDVSRQVIRSNNDYCKVPEAINNILKFYNIEFAHTF